MWFQKVGRERTGARGAVLGLVLLVAVVSGSCTPSYVTGNDAPVNLYVVAVNGGKVLDSDVRNGEDSSFVCPDTVQVTVGVRNKNPNAPAPYVPGAVLIQSYEVRYFRTDGRGTEGVDVPYRITGNLTLAVDVSIKDNVDVPIEVVRRQAKVEPPLSSIFQTNVLTTMAEITLYGQTVAGQSVSSTGRFQIDFADFVDTETKCPTVQ